MSRVPASSDWRDRLDVIERAIDARETTGDGSTGRRSIRAALDAVATDVAGARRELESLRPAPRTGWRRLAGSRRGDLVDRLTWLDALGECELAERRVTELGRRIDQRVRLSQT